ncbi:methyltransferase domain-containing protein [Candidatus Woesearchaeota archaeon]|nr:methyltransferase domain-containing protein [Candidatus Woesearchaeota archaeon]
MLFFKKNPKKNIEKTLKRLIKKGKENEVKKFLDFYEKENTLDAKFFWNVASYKWDERISLEVRNFIKKELSSLRGMNLSLGSGCYPYVKNSVLVDFSDEMLKKAEGCKKLKLDLNKGKLPFSENSFDSVTMVFVVDYLKNLDKLLIEVRRVLKDKGNLVIVNTKKPVDDFYRKQEIKHYNGEDLKRILKGFDAEIHEKRVKGMDLIFVNSVIRKPEKA